MITDLSIPEITLFEIYAKYGADCRSIICKSFDGFFDETDEYNVWPDLQNRMYWLGGAN